ncbi:MAG: RNA methyltransferase [Planctomycetota bacterium]
MVTRARLALYRSLHRGKVRREEGLSLVEGRRLVAEAIASGAALVAVLVTEEFRSSEEGAGLAAAAEAAGLAAEDVPARELARIAGTKTPQGVVGVIRTSASDEAVLAEPGLFLALDAVSDPGNAGTLIRAADAFAARAVLFGPGCADPWHPKTLRSAMGSSFHLPILAVDDLAARLTGMREAGAVVLAATLDGEDLTAAKIDVSRVVLVLGSEAHGVTPAVRAAADRAVTVPCPGRAESLNVAMAGAIALAHLAGRQDA